MYILPGSAVKHIVLSYQIRSEFPHNVYLYVNKAQDTLETEGAKEIIKKHINKTKD